MILLETKTDPSRRNPLERIRTAGVLVQWQDVLNKIRMIGPHGLGKIDRLVWGKTLMDIVEDKENIKNAWHCITRLRFELKDNEQIQVDAIKKMDGVLGTAFAKDQFQIIIGVGVEKYYEELVSQLGLDANAPVEADANEKRKDFTTWFMDVVSGIFGPLVPAIAGAGMIKGLMGGLVALGVITNTTDTYKVIDMLASGVFTFLPFFIAASAAKKFRTSQYLAIAIASIIMYPTMVSAA